MSMFEGGSARMLAIIEALSESGHRVFSDRCLVSEGDDEITEVVSELFVAARNIMCGRFRYCLL